MEELLPPPQAPAKPIPWRAIAAFFVPAASLAGGTGLQRLVEWPQRDAVLEWLCWSSAAGLLAGAVAGVALKRRWLWMAYGLAAPWMAAGLFAGVIRAAHPLREKIADRREDVCRSAGRAVCTMREFTARCAQAHADPSRARALLGDSRTPCDGRNCTMQWLYAGPFRPEEYTGPGALACFVLMDPQGHGVRHWLMAAEPP